MNKFEMIRWLEGKFVPVPNGSYKKVVKGRLQTGFGSFSLLQYEMGQIEKMVKYAREGD